jgi:hypothetical protein
MEEVNFDGQNTLINYIRLGRGEGMDKDRHMQWLSGNNFS